MKCQHCQEPFVAKRPWQKFCSTPCRHAENNMRRAIALDLNDAANLQMEAGVKTIQGFLLEYGAYICGGPQSRSALTLLEDILRAVGIPTKRPSQ